LKENYLNPNKLQITFLSINCTLFEKKEKVKFPNQLKKITMICHKKNKFWEEVTNLCSMNIKSLMYSSYSYLPSSSPNKPKYSYHSQYHKTQDLDRFGMKALNPEDIPTSL
jgi:alpha-galactosidase/6-phospho-beta-glucosidase family protein